LGISVANGYNDIKDLDAANIKITNIAVKFTLI
jgi:hypothetical protein